MLCSIVRTILRFPWVVIAVEVETDQHRMTDSPLSVVTNKGAGAAVAKTRNRIGPRFVCEGFQL